MTKRRDLYLIWSIEHDAWWAPARIGYTREIIDAGIYNSDDARAIVARANYPPGVFHECMIPIDCVGRAPQ